MLKRNSKLVIFLCSLPLILTLESLVARGIFNLLSEPSDIAFSIGVALLSVYFYVHFLIILYLTKNKTK